MKNVHVRLTDMNGQVVSERLAKIETDAEALLRRGVTPEEVAKWTGNAIANLLPCLSVIVTGPQYQIVRAL